MLQAVCIRIKYTYSGMQANQAHPRPQPLDPVLTQMYWTQLNKAINAPGAAHRRVRLYASLGDRLLPTEFLPRRVRL